MFRCLSGGQYTEYPEDLKPCPFCGAQPEMHDHCSAFGIHCQCGASVIGPRADQAEDHPESHYEQFRLGAIERWNKRIREH